MAETASQKLLELRNEEGAIKLKVKDFMYHFKEQSLGTFITLVSVPSALPIPAPGYSTPLGILLMIAALQLLCGRDSMWYPKRWDGKEFSISKQLVQGAVKFLRCIEFFTRSERCTQLQWILNKRVIGGNILILACIMAVPIPLTNTLPAAIILLFWIGLMENDGLLLCLAQLCSVTAIAIYSFAAYWISAFGVESLTKIFS